MATLAELRQQVRQRADVENSNFVSDAELNAYINSSYKELYDLLVATFEDYYTLDPVEFTLSGSTYTYDLPTNFYKLRGLDYKESSGGSDWWTVRPFVFTERNRVNNTFIGNVYAWDQRSYRIVGDKLYIYPQENAKGTYRIWYVPRATELAADTDTLDGVNGWEEYVIVDAAMKILIKEESDIQPLVLQKEQMRQRIIDMAKDRDVGEGDRIGDVYSDWDFPFGRR